MKESEVMLAIHEMEGIGWETMKTIVDTVSDLTLFLQYPASELLAGTKVSRKKRGDIEKFLTYEFIEGKLKFYKKCGVRPVTFFEPEYPPMLRYIDRPPWVIYTQGNLALLQKTSIAVVGTRNPTAYGREAAEWFGAELAMAGIPVVSGLARGIDSYAHAGALRTTGETIAVLGNGLNVCYPPEHFALQKAIAERGLVISEYSMNAQPSKGTFPWRNRLIAGISIGTIVVEAAERSGALRTADYALTYGKEVFGVPGPITSPKSIGVYNLIRSGAKLAISPKDVAEEFGIFIKRTPDCSEPLSDEEAELLQIMGGEPMSIDELITASNHTFGHLHTVLLSLLVKNRIRALPGSRYIARMN